MNSLFKQIREVAWRGYDRWILNTHDVIVIWLAEAVNRWSDANIVARAFEAPASSAQPLHLWRAAEVVTAFAARILPFGVRFRYRSWRLRRIGRRLFRTPTARELFTAAVAHHAYAYTCAKAEAEKITCYPNGSGQGKTYTLVGVAPGVGKNENWRGTADEKAAAARSSVEEPSRRRNRWLRSATTIAITGIVAALAGLFGGYNLRALNDHHNAFSRSPEIRRAIRVQPEIRRATPVEPEIRKAIPLRTKSHNRGPRLKSSASSVST